MSTLSLIVRRTVRASQERLFDAWTTPAELQRWWGPAHVRCVGAEVDLRVGGEYRIGNELPDGNVVWIVGEFEEIDRPRRLVYSWRTHTNVERVTVRFEPAGDATEVIIVHERMADAATRADHEHGWLGCLDGLEGLVAEGDSPRKKPIPAARDR